MDNKTDRISILIVDDHPVVRNGLAGMISPEPDMEVVAEAGSGEQAIECYRELRPDVTLMDLYMRGMDGVEAIQKIRGIDPGARIVVLTTYDGDENIHRALEAGADSYLLKDMFREDILDTIRRVHAGGRTLPREVQQRLAQRIPGNELTSRELAVLRMIARGFSNKEIASDLGITEATVKSHVNAILGKLAVSDRTQAALAALQRGFVHVD